MRTLADHPEAQRTIQDVANFSGPPHEFLTAARSSRVWGAATAPLREDLGAIAEMTLFPGLAILALALLGARAGPLPRRLRRGLAVGVLAFAILSLGVQLNGLSWLYPYRWLYALLPGWQGIRVPGRLNTLTSLCLALLAAGGAQLLAARVRARWGPRAAAGAVTLACSPGRWRAARPRSTAGTGSPRTSPTRTGTTTPSSRRGWRSPRCRMYDVCAQPGDWTTSAQEQANSVRQSAEPARAGASWCGRAHPPPNAHGK